MPATSSIPPDSPIHIHLHANSGTNIHLHATHGTDINLHIRTRQQESDVESWEELTNTMVDEICRHPQQDFLHYFAYKFVTESTNF